MALNINNFTYALLESLDIEPMLPSVDSLLACFSSRLRISAAAPTSSLRWNDARPPFFPPFFDTNNKRYNFTTHHQCVQQVFILEKDHGITTSTDRLTGISRRCFEMHSLQ